MTKKIRISRKRLVVDGERDQRCTQKGIKEQKTKRQDKSNRDVRARREAEKNSSYKIIIKEAETQRK